MGDGFDRKGDVAILRSRLVDAELKHDKIKYREAVQKVVALMTLGVDTSALFPDMMKACATDDLRQKKLGYLFICSYAELHADLALLTVNTLVKDTQDDNPMVRGLALRNMLNLRLPNLLSYATTPLLNGLEDSNSYVRRNAVMGCVKMFQMAPDKFAELSLVSKLSEMIYDNDVDVSVNALVATNEVLHRSGGISLNKSIVTYLLERLHLNSAWGQGLIMQCLSKYEPSDDEEVLTYLNLLDDRLRHTNRAVSLAAVNLFLRFTSNMDYIRTDVLDRIRLCFVALLPTCPPEILYSLLCHVSVLTGHRQRLFHNDFKMFFLRNSDPSYIQQKKLEVLVDVTTEGNLASVMDELCIYVLNSRISFQACSSICEIGIKNRACAKSCVTSLVNLLQHEVDYITAQCLEKLQSLMAVYEWVAQEVQPHLANCWSLVQDHPPGKAALIWMIGECGENIYEAPYLLEKLVNSIEHEHSPTVKSHLLLACMKLFFKRAPECQHILGRTLQHCIDEDNDMGIRDRAMMYYRLLKLDTSSAKEVVSSLHKNKAPCLLNMKDSSKTDSFQFEEFNSLSVVYGYPVTKLSSDMTTDVLVSDVTASNLSDAGNDFDSSGWAVRHSEDVVQVEDLLGNLQPVTLKLESGVTVDPSAFEKEWFSAPHSLASEKNLLTVPTYEVFLSSMRSKNLYVVASSPEVDQPVMRFYMYARFLSDSDGVLLETVVNTSRQTMLTTLKGSSEDMLDEFQSYFTTVCVASWV